MTVAELIAELAKFPPYYPVMLVTTPGGFGFSDDDTEWWSIGDLQVESSLGSAGCVVKILAEDAE